MHCHHKSVNTAQAKIIVLMESITIAHTCEDLVADTDSDVPKKARNFLFTSWGGCPGTLMVAVIMGDAKKGGGDERRQDILAGNN